MRFAALLVLAAVCAAIPAAMADTLRWVNPAGGAFTDAANWDLGRLPTNVDQVLFDLPTTYTVTMPVSMVQVFGMDVLGGHVTLQGLSAAQPGTLSITPGSGQLRLLVGNGTSPAAFSLSNTSITTANAHMEIRAQGTAVMLSGGSYFSSNFGELRVLPGGVLRVDGGGVNPSYLLIQGGTAIVTAGGLRGEVVNVSHGSTVRAAGPTARFTYQLGMTLRGLVEVTQAAEITLTSGGAQAVLAESCNLQLSDGGQVRLGVGFRNDAASVVRLSAGANWTVPISDAQYRGPFFAGPGTTVLLEGTYSDIVELDQAGANSQGFLGRFQGGLTAALDALIDPAVPVVRRSTSAFSNTVLAGTLTVRVRNGNALRIGDVIPVLEHNQTTHGAFAQVVLPPLGGGRIMQVYSQGTPLTTYARIVQGPPSCYLNADFDGDGDVGTDADIEAFFACLAGTCCSTCASADFNGDGDTGTDADIEGFFTVLAGGSC